ncbi:hypothetical protein AB0J21_32485 [Streptomyces sp. NPDC049954]|uniref:hypothetical protein n=1 Tax=Streptomyces sp. NPDC049954 TaxID=3155779 RepID=UPI003434A243
MGSMRNPVGPLPSSIYWRRRGILGVVLLLVVLLVVWLLSLGGSGGGKKDGASGSNGGHPAPSSITPGPGDSGPAISQHPGGRDESGDSAGSGGGSGGDSDGGPGDGSSAGSGASGGSGDAKGSGGSGDSAGSGGDSGQGGGSSGAAGSGSGASGAVAGGPANLLPAGSSLADCTSSSVELTLRSKHNTYEPDQKPVLQLTVKNSSGSACKVDLGPRRTVVTIALTGEDSSFWASDDCPAAGGVLLRVPAHDSVRYDVTWDREASAGQCATPKAKTKTARPGTYLVEARAPGLPKARTSFRLDKD